MSAVIRGKSICEFAGWGMEAACAGTIHGGSNLFRDSYRRRYHLMLSSETAETDPEGVGFGQGVSS